MSGLRCLGNSYRIIAEDVERHNKIKLVDADSPAIKNPPHGLLYSVASAGSCHVPSSVNPWAKVSSVDESREQKKRRKRR
jgi:hypothetical protein